MKKLDLSPIEANVRGMVLEDKTIAHILESNQEGFEAILLALGCDPNEITILSGAVVDGSGDPDFTVTSGWAAYGGELFQVDAGDFTANDGETAIWIIETTYPATDPVKFDDGSEFNINQIRKLKLESGISGSGVKDWDDTYEFNNLMKTPKGSPELLKKAIQIGDWNCRNGGASLTGFNIEHGLTNPENIIGVSILIRNDDGSELRTIYQEFFEELDTILVDETQLTIGLRNLFPDDGNWDTSSDYNRGWVTITYYE